MQWIWKKASCVKKFWVVMLQNTNQMLGEE